MNQANLPERLAAIRERIVAGAKRAGRTADEITLIAVSKTHSAAAIRAAFDLGVSILEKIEYKSGKGNELY